MDDSDSTLNNFVSLLNDLTKCILNIIIKIFFHYNLRLYSLWVSSAIYMCINGIIKCDLHMHSQYSKQKDKGRVKEMTVKEFIDILLEKDIQIFSVTHHNTYSNKFYSEIKDHIKDKNIRIINDVEFDVYVGDDNDIEINSGQLSSVEVLRQDQISQIYENPELANEHISNFFVDIESYDMSYIYKIIDVAKKIVIIIKYLKSY